jgi:hypothetical protein
MPNDTTSTLSLILIAVVLAGTCLLISAPAGQEYGAQAWSSDSILKPIVDAMALYYEHPTPATVDVKGLVLRLGASVAIGIGVIGWFGATRRPIDDDPQGSPTHEPVDPTGSRWTHLAQLMMLVFVAVMLLSRFWSHAPRYTLYAALLLTMQVGWALALARTVNLRGVLISVAVIVAVSAVTAGVGIWYHHERNPVVDLKFPIGNPLFLAACMIPSLVLAPSLIVGLFTSRSARDTWKTWVFVVLLIAGFWSANTALSLTGARSTQAGLAAGVLVFAFLATRRLASSIRRIITAGLLIVVLFGATGAAYWVKGRSEEVAHSQGASLRMRFYAWQYALELFAERPLIGHGRGTVPLLVEAKAADEVLADPMAFFGRAVGHTHHEWLAGHRLAGGGLCPDVPGRRSRPAPRRPHSARALESDRTAHRAGDDDGRRVCRRRPANRGVSRVLLHGLGTGVGVVGRDRAWRDSNRRGRSEPHPRAYLRRAGAGCGFVRGSRRLGGHDSLRGHGLDRR